jgi:hypothetical protein
MVAGAGGRKGQGGGDQGEVIVKSAIENRESKIAANVLVVKRFHDLR